MVLLLPGDALASGPHPDHGCGHGSRCYCLSAGPAFYARPASREMVDHTLCRVLDLFDIDFGKIRRWTGEKGAIATQALATQVLMRSSLRGRDGYPGVASTG